MNEIEEFYPLSPLQEGLLFHSLYSPESDVYVGQLSCALRGRLNTLTFQRAWQELVNRHSVLRTYFVWEGISQPVQVVCKEANMPWHQEDWRGLSPEEQERRRQAYLEADRAKGIDPSALPLMRAALFRTADDAYDFVWTHHHILLDGWSTPLLLEELSTLYDAFSTGRDAPASTRRPYRDYIAWLQRQDRSEAKAFWEQALKGFTTPTPLPFDRSKTGYVERGTQYADHQIRLSAEETETLQAWARQHQLTLNTVLQGAWAMLLSRCSGASDVMFGAVVSGRPADFIGVESMVGLFINTLPVRVKVDGGQELLPFLKALQRQQAQARQFDYLPLSELQRRSEVAAGTPLFDSLFVFENYPTYGTGQSGAGKGNLEVTIYRTVEHSNYALTVCSWPDARLPLRIGYDRSRFDEASIERILTFMAALLKSIGGRTGIRVFEATLLSEAERRQALVEWNATAKPYPSHLCVQDLFTYQAQQTPDAVALVYEGQQMSYAELDRRSNQVANYLAEMEVGLETRVGVCVERSLDMIVAVLGVLKAGAVYVPLDSSYPAERLAYMLEDSQAHVLLTQHALRGILPNHPAKKVALDADWAAISDRSASGMSISAQPDALAYIMYTSGSTGTPKGIGVTHRGVVRLVKNNDFVHINPEDSFLQFAPISFDASTFEIWASLLNGCRLVLAPASSLSLSELGSLLSRFKITTLWLTAGLFHQIVDDELASLSGVEQLLAGGDVLSGAHVNKVIDALPGCRLINGYGPTENTTFTCCQWVVERCPGASSPPIGKPIANTQVYVVDERQQPVPVGVAGELLIAGAGLARGYLNRPDLTAERFIPDSLSGESGARVYRSGDKVRWLAEGELEYIGRLDEQVKIRGFRIEPGEIEAVLMQHASVSQCVVVVREDQSGDRRLVAYVVQTGEGNASGAELRQYVSGKLPEYMLPSAIVMMESLPLTPNGKVDKRALPAPQMERPQGESRPKTAVEEIVAGVWCDVLRVADVSAEDNFFELGGHSLLATQVISRIRSLFQVELPLRAVFESPTVAELAKRVEQARFSRGKAQAPALVPRSREGELALSYAQQRLWFLDQLEPGSSAYNIPMAVRLIGSLDVEALSRSISEIVRRHEVLRTRFVAVEGRPQQQIDEPAPVRVPVIDLSQIQQREQAANQLVQQEASRPFELSRGPLMRVMLMRLGEQEHVLMVNMHHIVSDGWSVEILIRELHLLYEAYSEGKPSPLDELAIQYADFAMWQRGWLSGDVLEEQLDYWKRQLAGIEPLQMPTDRQRPAVATHRGGTVPVSLSAELSEQLRQVSRQEGVTLFMLILAAFKVLLSRYSGQSDIAVGTPIANRNRAEIEPLIGFFVNTLVMRSQIKPQSSFRELLAEVRDVALGAYEHQDVPFERLVDEIAIERDLNRSPLFQVVLVFQNIRSQARSTKSLEITQLPDVTNNAKRDLTLYVWDRNASITGLAVFNPDLFAEDTIKALMKSFQDILAAVCANAEAPIDDLAWSENQEIEQMAAAFSDDLDWV